jgi:hypothetical protein
MKHEQSYTRFLDIWEFAPQRYPRISWCLQGSPRISVNSENLGEDFWIFRDIFRDILGDLFGYPIVYPWFSIVLHLLLHSSPSTSP